MTTLRSVVLLAVLCLLVSVSTGLQMRTSLKMSTVTPTNPDGKRLTAMGPYAPTMPKSKSLPFLPCPPNLDGYAGNREFDPLWLSETTPMDWMREAELKHGRVCMLASLGWVAVDLGFRFPKEEFKGVMSMDAHNVGVESGLMTVLFAAIFCVEFLGVIMVQQMLAGSGRVPGDYFFDPMGFSDEDAAYEIMQEKEIEHCRLSMLGFAGIVTQAVLTGNGFPYVFSQLTTGLD